MLNSPGDLRKKPITDSDEQTGRPVRNSLDPRTRVGVHERMKVMRINKNSKLSCSKAYKSFQTSGNRFLAFSRGAIGIEGLLGATSALVNLVAQFLYELYQRIAILLFGGPLRYLAPAVQV